MGDSCSDSSWSDKEDCISECHSNLSLSVGYFPSEESITCEDTHHCEASTSLGPSTYFLPPVQGAWGTKHVKTPMRRRDKPLDNPEDFWELPFPWDVDACADSLDKKRMEECPQERGRESLSKLDNLLQILKKFLHNQKNTKDHGALFSDAPEEEDVQPSRSVPGLMCHIRHKEEGSCEALPKCPENEIINQFVEMPPITEEDELPEVCDQGRTEISELNCMEDLLLDNNYSDKEDCTSKSKTYFNCADRVPCEDSTSLGSSTYFKPAVQQEWGTKSVSTPMEGQEQIQNNAEQLCEGPITQVLDAYLAIDGEKPLDTLDLHGDAPRMDQSPQERGEQAICELDHLMQALKVFLEDHKPVVFPDSAVEEGVQPSSSIPVNMCQVITQETGMAEIPSVSAEQTEKEDKPSNTESTC